MIEFLELTVLKCCYESLIFRENFHKCKLAESKVVLVMFDKTCKFV